MNNKIKFEKNIAAYSILQRNAVIDRKSNYIYSNRKEFNKTLFLHIFHILITNSI